MNLNSEVFKKVIDECGRFWAETDPKSCTVPELVDRFMTATDPALPASLKLHSFVCVSHDHLGWTGLCEVCEYILANDLDPGGESGIYHLWTLTGTAVMKDAANHSLDERVRVAADLEAIFERAAHELGYYWENTLGHFYYGHPQKIEQPQLYLLSPAI